MYNNANVIGGKFTLIMIWLEEGKKLNVSFRGTRRNVWYFV